MKKVCCGILTIAVVLCLGIAGSAAQTKQASPEKPVHIITRTVDLKYAEPTQVISTLNPIAKASGTILTFDMRNKILLITGDPERIAEMETLVRRIDMEPMPDRSIEITAYLLLATDEAGSPQSVPAALEPALKQLRTTFSYKTYQLLDTLFLRNRTGGGGSTSGKMTLPEAQAKGGAAPARGGMPQGSYEFNYDRSYLTREDKGDVIHLSGLKLTVFGGGSISTDLDLRSGQTVVLGKTSARIENTGLIAIISARIVD